MIRIFDANAVFRQSLNAGFPLDARKFYMDLHASDFWVWDGGRHNERRQKIWPQYKMRDYTGQENIFAGLELYRHLLALSPSIQIAVPTYEADDVCYTLAKKLTSQGVPVTISTNDFDFYQMVDNPLITLKGVKAKDGVAPKHVSVFKAFCGDSSDKIPGIPGFGPKTWTAFAPYYDEAKAALQSRDITALRELPFPPRCKSWLIEDENALLICDFFDITTMIEVPEDLIAEHTLIGKPAPWAAEEVLRKFAL